jgi:hypothetical protein
MPKGPMVVTHLWSESLRHGVIVDGSNEYDDDVDTHESFSVGDVGEAFEIRDANEEGYEMQQHNQHIQSVPLIVPPIIQAVEDKLRTQR